MTNYTINAAVIGVRPARRPGAAAVKFLGVMMLLVSLLPSLFAQELDITQVDSTSLLSSGELDIYLSLEAAPASLVNELETGNILVQDDGGQRLEVRRVAINPLRNEGLTLFLLLDNSGSMHEGFNGNRSRWDEALAALRSFLEPLERGSDRLGLGVFNTRLAIQGQPGSAPSILLESLNRIEAPGREESYTELYNALVDSGELLSALPGRKVIIVLTDGENYPVYSRTGSPNPQWDSRDPQPAQIAETLQAGGVSLYAINFAARLDPALASLSASTGGKIYNAEDGTELARIYDEIRLRTLREHRLSVAAPSPGAARGTLKVSLGSLSDSIPYRLPLLYGGHDELGPAIPLAILAAILAMIFVLFFIPFERMVRKPQIAVIDSAATVALRQDVTVIGSARSADLTVAGDGAVHGQHATIVREKDGGFTLVSDHPVQVNNRKVRRKALEAGDVIDVEGVTIVFDQPSATSTGTPDTSPES